MRLRVIAVMLFTLANACSSPPQTWQEAYLQWLDDGLSAEPEEFATTCTIFAGWSDELILDTFEPQDGDAGGFEEVDEILSEFDVEPSIELYRESVGLFLSYFRENCP